MWLILRPFWKHIAIAIAALLLIWIVRSWYHAQLKDAYNEGVHDTEDKQAEVIAKRMLENEKRERDMARLIADKQLELQVKDNANLVLSNNLDRLANERMRCLSDKVRRSPVPENPGTAGNSNAAAPDPRPAQTLGSAVVELVTECQRSTDKLISLQEYFRELKARGF